MKIRIWSALFIFLSLPTFSFALNSALNPTTELSCFDASKVSIQDQCRFIQDNCNINTYKIGKADYLKLYYCSTFRKSSLVLIYGTIFLCFASLALTASDYLCPNLYSISKFLQLSDNLAGLTLLALGNGAPDVLSTFKALDVDATGLAVSELIGAALFILTVVVGAISWARPFKVPKFHFVRDISFYLAISLICLLILIMGSLSYWSSALLFSTYAMYVAVVLFSHSVLWENVVHKVNISRLRSNYDEDSVSDLGESRLDYFVTDRVPQPSIDILITPASNEEHDEFNKLSSSHPQNGKEERALMETGSYGMRILLKKLSSHASSLPQNTSSVLLTTERQITATSSAEHLEELIDTQTEPTLAQGENSAASRGNTFMSILFPKIDTNASIISRIHGAFIYPTNSILRITTPNREQAIEHGQSISYNAFNFNPSVVDMSLEEESNKFDSVLDSRLFKLQIVTFPILVAFSCFESSLIFWVTLPCLVVLFYGFTRLIPDVDSSSTDTAWKCQLWNNVGSFMGFIASIIWISIFATEIVAILKAMSVIFAIRDDVLGSTVFALGNSVGDLVSNIIIARMGMPVMAFGACFGGPLLSISSLGFSGAVILYKKGYTSIPIEFSGPLKSNCFALIITLIFLAASIPWNGWKFDKRIGIVLIMIWAGSCALTVLTGI